jgi:hypothetical protein
MIVVTRNRSGSAAHKESKKRRTHNPFTMKYLNMCGEVEIILDTRTTEINHALFYPTGHSASDESTWHTSEC